MNLLDIVRQLYTKALEGIVTDPETLAFCLNNIRACKDPKHGHYQATFVPFLAKKLGRDPHELAREISARLMAVDLNVAAPPLCG